MGESGYGVGMIVEWGISRELVVVFSFVCINSARGYFVVALLSFYLIR